MWQIILYAVLFLVALYAFTATIFLFLAQLEKDEKGKLFIDPDSWHFKVAYPIGRYKVLDALNALKPDSGSKLTRYEAKKILASYRKGLCAYFFKFFFMLYLGWPVFVVGLIIILIILYAIIQVVAFPFGFYMVDITGESILWKRYPLPRIYGIRLLPVYFIVMLGYAALWYFFPSGTPSVTGQTLGVVGIGLLLVGVVWAIVSAISWLRHTDGKSVNVVREWVSAKKEGVCPMVEIKSPDA